MTPYFDRFDVMSEPEFALWFALWMLRIGLVIGAVLAIRWVVRKAAGIRKLTGIGKGHLYNPWWCTSFMRGHGSTAWWRVCDMFGISISNRRPPYKWPTLEQEKEYTLCGVGLLGWRIKILRPRRYRRFPWERKPRTYRQVSRADLDRQGD